jgi:hypothetical protein
MFEVVKWRIMLLVFVKHLHYIIKIYFVGMILLLPIEEIIYIYSRNIL